MKTLALLALFAGSMSAQIAGNLSDAPQHIFAVGIGVGPTSRDFAAEFGFGEKVGTVGTYSYTQMSFVPAIVNNANGSKSLLLTTTATTGLKQILYQTPSGGFTVAVNATAGTTIPTQSIPVNLAAVGGFDFVKRIKPGLGLAIEPRFTTVSGSNSQTIVSLGIGLVHGVN